MSTTTVILALVLGLGAGILSGLFGVGGGTLFVPTLVLVVGLDQLDAQSTSLAAMIPVIVFGAWQQHRAGNVRLRAGLASWLFSVLGVAAEARRWPSSLPRTSSERCSRRSCSSSPRSSSGRHATVELKAHDG